MDVLTSVAKTGLLSCRGSPLSILQLVGEACLQSLLGCDRVLYTAAALRCINGLKSPAQVWLFLLL